MKAIIRYAYGEVDVLRLGEIATPVASGGEVLLRVVAAGVDQGVWHQRRPCGGRHRGRGRGGGMTTT
jgi:NADPH:quinone reductase-like Zn-dependent oxidoreductase